MYDMHFCVCLGSMNHFVIHRIHREIHIDSIFFMTTISICAYICMERLRVQYKLVCHYIIVAQYDDWYVTGYIIWHDPFIVQYDDWYITGYSIYIIYAMIHSLYT